MLWGNITLGNVGGVCCRIIANLLWNWLTLGMRGYKKWSALKGLRNFQSIIWPRHSLRRPRFPVTKMYFYYRVTFTGYIWCFYATMSNDLLTLTFDLLTLSVSCTVLLMSHPHTNFYYPITIGYWVTSTEYLITFPLSKQSLCMRRVTWPLTGGKNNPIFEIPDPNLPIHFVTFRAPSHVIGKK